MPAEAWSLRDLFPSPQPLLRHTRSSSADPGAFEWGVSHAGRSGRRLAFPLLHYLAYRGCVEAVKACLAACLQPIDFTLPDGRGRTLLHVVCDEVVSGTATHEMLQAVVRRLETHPEDVVDWERRDHLRQGVLKRAAENQKLSVVWPLLNNVPQIADRPFALSFVWRADWDRLSDDEKLEHFTVKPHRIIEADPPTARLCQLSWQPEAKSSEIEPCVREGADVCYGKWGETTVLQSFMAQGRVDAVRACLMTSRPIDFTACDERGRTLLHWLVYV